jgi:hypothetical protein
MESPYLGVFRVDIFASIWRCAEGTSAVVCSTALAILLVG